MQNLSTLFLLLISNFLIGQSLTGKIIDTDTQKGLAYVNIGVVGKNIGTVSAPDGSFRLKLPKWNRKTEELKNFHAWVPKYFI